MNFIALKYIYYPKNSDHFDEDTVRREEYVLCAQMIFIENEAESLQNAKYIRNIEYIYH